MENNISNDNLLYTSLIEFYNKDRNIEKLNEIINSSKISLRIIDWFVTNYSKKYNIHYSLYETKGKKITMNNTTNILYKQISVYQSYKSQLKSYSKHNFDPFCRRTRIMFLCKNYEISTTIGQLNFFKWAIENLLIDYIKQNYNLIEEDMNFSISNKKKYNLDKRKKREELSKSASRGLNKNSMKVVISFD